MALAEVAVTGAPGGDKFALLSINSSLKWGHICSRCTENRAEINQMYV